MFDAALSALTLLFEPTRLAILSAGVIVGLIIGALPGLGGVVGLAILIPFTYQMDSPVGGERRSSPIEKEVKTKKSTAIRWQSIPFLTYARRGSSKFS